MIESRERNSKEESMVGKVWRERFMSIFVGGINRDCKEADLWEALSPFGVVMDIYILRRLGKPRGFAFIRFQRQADFNRLLEKMSVIRVGGSVL